MKSVLKYHSYKKYQYFHFYLHGPVSCPLTSLFKQNISENKLNLYSNDDNNHGSNNDNNDSESFNHEFDSTNHED